MYTQGYNPNFWSQEYVEKLILENYPVAKINDIVSFQTVTFEQVPVYDTTGANDIVLYYGFIKTNDGNSVDLSCYDNSANVITVTLSNYASSFPLLTFGVAAASSNVLFTGWKIVCSAPLFSDADSPGTNYSLIDSIIFADQGTNTVRPGGVLTSLYAEFANENSPTFTDDAGTSALTSGGSFDTAAVSSASSIFTFTNNSTDYRTVNVDATKSYFDTFTYPYNELVSGLDIFTQLRPGLLSLQIGTMVAGTFTPSGIPVNNGFGSAYSSLAVLPGVQSLSYAGSFPVNSVLKVSFVDDVFGPMPDVFYKIASTWAVVGTRFLTTAFISGGALTDVEQVQIQGTPGATVQLTLSSLTNSNGGTVSFNTTSLTSGDVGTHYNIVLSSTGYSSVLNFAISGLSGHPGTAILAKFDITSVSAGTITSPSTYQISKVF